MTDAFERLLRSARAARDNAYAPYSGFRVGAALETADGAVFSGCNVENASYGLTLCAERSALAAAVAAGHRSFARIAVSTSAGAPASPCGLCRQALAEFAPGLSVRSESPEGAAGWSLAALLPEPFRLNEGDGRATPRTPRPHPRATVSAPARESQGVSPAAPAKRHAAPVPVVPGGAS